MSLQPSDPAADAFERLRLEVALLRRAIEGVAAGADAHPIDYSPTLAEIRKAVAEWGAHTIELGERPILALSPGQLTDLADLAAARLFARPLAALDAERERLRRATEAVDALRTAAQARSRSWRRALALLGGGALAGAVVWGVLLGPLARMLPPGWAAPERAAAATLGVSLAESGALLLRRTDPDAWATLDVARRLTEIERAALRECISRVEARQVRTCNVRVSGG